MKRIIWHWSASRYNQLFPLLYHFMIDDKGKIYNGQFLPEDNLNCNDGKYAQHTGGGNTGSIGLCLLSMLGFVNRNNPRNFPITKKQCEAGFKKTAELCRKYGITKITPDTIMTHYEFGLKNPNTSSKGKIDIVYLPPYPEIGQNDIGDFIRLKVKWYLGRLL